MASSSWIGRSHWGDAYFNGEIAGLYAFSASLTDREVDRILAGIHINATDNFETSHHNDKVLHDAHQTCSACPGDMYAPAGSTGISQCQHVCPAGTYAESVRLYPSDRNVDASWPASQNGGSPSYPTTSADTMGDFDFSTHLTGGYWDPNGDVLECIQIDLGKIYPVSKLHVWQYFLDGRTYHGQSVRLSKTGLWTSTEQTGDEIIAWSCTTNCPAEISSGAGRIIEFEPVNARFIRHCSTGTFNGANHWVEVHVYGTLCTSCPAGSHSPRGSTSHSDCLCESQHSRDYGNYTDKYMEDRTGVKGWTLAKHLTKDGTKWFSRDHMLSSRWVVGTAGATCDDTCGALNLKCNSPAQTTITSSDLLQAAIQDIWGECEYTGERNYAGTPFIHSTSNKCYAYTDTWTDTSQTQQYSSVCDSNAHSVHRPLCHCVGFSDYEQTTHTYHPDWTEILFVRAPKTSNEKWVRMSREVWDSIAASDDVRPGQTNNYDNMVVNVIDMFPAHNPKTITVTPRNTAESLGGAPYVWFPPSSSTHMPSLHADRRKYMIYAQHTDYLYNRDTYWPDRKTGVVDGALYTIDEEFQVFVRAPTWRDHYVGCMGSAVLPPGASLLGVVESVTTFLDAILLCSGYEYAGIMCGKTVICFSVEDPSQFTHDGECRGQQTSYDPGSCQAPENPNIGPDGSSMGGLSTTAV